MNLNLLDGFESDNSIKPLNQTSKLNKNIEKPLGSLISHEVSIQKIEKSPLEEEKLTSQEKIINISNQVIQNQKEILQENLDQNPIFDSKDVKNVTTSLTDQDVIIENVAMEIEIKHSRDIDKQQPKDLNHQLEDFEKINGMAINYIQKQVISSLNEKENNEVIYKNSEENSLLAVESVDDQDFFEFGEEISGLEFDTVNNIEEETIKTEEETIKTEEETIKTEEETIKTEEETIKIEEKTDQKNSISDELIIQSDKAFEISEKVIEQGDKTTSQAEKVTKESVDEVTSRKKMFYKELNNKILNEFNSQGYEGIDTKLVKKYIRKFVDYNNPSKKHLYAINKYILEKNIDAGGVTRNGVPETRESFKKYEIEFKAKFSAFYNTDIKQIFDSRKSEIEKEIQAKKNQNDRSNSTLTKSPNELKDLQQIEKRIEALVTVFIKEISDVKFIRIFEERLAEFTAQMEALQRSRREIEDENYFEIKHSIIQREILKMILSSEEIKKLSLKADILSHNILTAELTAPYTFLVTEAR